MKSLLLTSTFFQSWKFLTSFSILLVPSFYFELKKQNKAIYVTTFLSFELLEKVGSTCKNMASETWFDPDWAFLIPEMGMILGCGAALISWIYYEVPERADHWQAFPGQKLRHLASWEVLERSWGKGKATHRSQIEKGLKFVVLFYTVLHQLEVQAQTFLPAMPNATLWSHSQFTPSPSSALTR